MLNQLYEPEIWPIKKDLIYAAIKSVRGGLDYAQECLTAHDESLGRTIRKNRLWAETIERDMKQMADTLSALHKCNGE